MTPKVILYCGEACPSLSKFGEAWLAGMNMVEADGERES